MRSLAARLLARPRARARRLRRRATPRALDDRRRRDAGPARGDAGARSPATRRLRAPCGCSSVGSGWAVVQSTRAGAARARVALPPRRRPAGGADRSDRVAIAILGPQPGRAVAPALPQVAIEITAKQPFVESALWVDGTELQTKGGGTPTNGTIYGAPARRARGRHATSRSATRAPPAPASARAWIFRVGA